MLLIGVLLNLVGRGSWLVGVGKVVLVGKSRGYQKKDLKETTSFVM